jgi:hypothetical protein
MMMGRVEYQGPQNKIDCPIIYWGYNNSWSLILIMRREKQHLKIEA